MIATAKTTYPVYSVRFWASYLIQMRPYLLFVSGVAGMAGIAMAKDPVTSNGTILFAFLPFFLGYGFGQALTDCFQTDTDKLSSPYRPLSREVIRIKDVLIVSITGLALSGILLLSFHWLSFLGSLAAVFGLATYSFVKKQYWFGGPFYNGWIVALLPLMGYFAMKQTGETAFPARLLPYLFVTFFSYGSFVLIGYLKDIDADRATGYKTFPVVWGWQKTMVAGDVFALATLYFFWSQPTGNGYEMACGIAASLVTVGGQVAGHLTRQKNERGALFPILSTVRSFILFHLAIVLHFQPQWLYYSLVYYVLFEIFLYRRPSPCQV